MSGHLHKPNMLWDKADVVSDEFKTRLAYNHPAIEGLVAGKDKEYMEPELKRKLRDRHGFCLTCLGVPVQIYNHKKSLWWDGVNHYHREPRTHPGECYLGICLKCYPEADPKVYRLSKSDDDGMWHAPKLNRIVHIHIDGNGKASQFSTFREDEGESLSQRELAGVIQAARVNTPDRAEVLDAVGSNAGPYVPYWKRKKSFRSSVVAKVKSGENWMEHLENQGDKTRKSTLKKVLTNVFVLGNKTGEVAADDGVLCKTPASGICLEDQPANSITKTNKDDLENRDDVSYANLVEPFDANRKHHSSILRKEFQVPSRTGPDLEVTSSNAPDGYVPQLGKMPNEVPGVCDPEYGPIFEVESIVVGGEFDDVSELGSGSFRLTRPIPGPQRSSPPTTNRRQRLRRGSQDVGRDSATFELENGTICGSLTSLSEDFSVDITSNRRASYGDISGYSLPPIGEEYDRPGKPSSENAVCDLQILIDGMTPSCDEDPSMMLEIIVSAMREHAYDEELQEYSLLKICNMCEGGKSKARSVATDDVIDVVVNAIKSSSIKIRVAGCNAVGALAISSKTRGLLLRAGVCRYIAKIMAHPTEVDEIASKALRTARLLTSDGNARNAFKSLRATECVVQVMKEHILCPEIQCDGCAFLTNCAVDVERQTVATISQEEISAVVVAMKTHRNDKSVMAGACFALSSFSHGTKNCRKIFRCDDVVDLLSYATTISDSEACSRDAGATLNRLRIAYAADVSREERMENELLETLENTDKASASTLHTFGDYMKSCSWSPKLMVSCLECILSIISENDEQKRRLLADKRILKSIASAVGNGENPDLAKNGSLVLRTTIDGVDSSYDALLSAGIGSYLFQALHHFGEEEEVVDSIIAALAPLSLMPEIWQDSEGEDKASIVTKVMQRYNTNYDIQLNGMTIISNLDILGLANN